MNAPIRRLATVVAMLFVSLLISSTIIQVFLAPGLNNRGDNTRTLTAAYSRDRGAILVKDTEIAKSTASKDEYKYQRSYPQGPQYAHVTGWFSFYGAGGGLESAENAMLSGSSDQLFIRRVSDVFTGRKPAGASLELTLDPRVQAAAIKALGNQKGAAVAIDPKTGAILAMVSVPTYDPNTLATHDFTAAAKTSEKLNADKDRPLVNRTIGGDLYPPGSTFKLVTAAAALSSGRFTPDSVLDGPARMKLPQSTATIDNAGGEVCGAGGKVTMADALRISCNTAFAKLGLDLGDAALRDQAKKFGIGDRITVPMSVTPSVFPAEVDEPQTAQVAIGGYEVRMSPLQVAMITASIANGGTVMQPYLVSSVLTRDLQVIDSATPSELSTAMTPEVASQLTAMMESAVESGTGTAARIDGIRVAGKTGTARYTKDKAPHAWFTAFAPVDEPRIAVAVVVENGGDLGSEASGGRVAAPIARAMIQALLRS